MQVSVSLIFTFSVPKSNSTKQPPKDASDLLGGVASEALVQDAQQEEDDEGEKLEGPSENLLEPQTKISRNDFAFLKVIGRGSFGKVYMVKKRGTNQIYALKTLNKDVIAKRNLLIKTQGKPPPV